MRKVKLGVDEALCVSTANEQSTVLWEDSMGKNQWHDDGYQFAKQFGSSSVRNIQTKGGNRNNILDKVHISSSVGELGSVRTPAVKKSLQNTFDEIKT